MALPTVDSLNDWARLTVAEQVARHLLETVPQNLRECLQSNPYETLVDHLGITIVETTNDAATTATCGLYGFYRPSPPTITLVSSSGARDNFTLLHEFGHHLQRNDLNWATPLATLRRRRLAWVEETVSHLVASLILVPDDSVAHVRDRGTVDASTIRDIHEASSASAHAIIVRLKRLLPEQALAVCLLTSEGRVTFSLTLGEDLLPPPFDSIQPDLAEMAKRTRDSGHPQAGASSHGIRYRTGKTRNDLTLNVAPLANGLLVATVRPQATRGRQQWGEGLEECPSEACATTFIWDDAVAVCPRCGRPRCPECRTCSCDDPAPTLCTECFLTLSKADAAAGRKICEDCLE